MLAAALTASLLWQDQHFDMDQLGLLWTHGDKANPVAALRKTLHLAGVGGDLGRWTCGGRELQAPLDSLEATRNEWLAEAQKKHDVAKV